MITQMTMVLILNDNVIEIVIVLSEIVNCNYCISVQSKGTLWKRLISIRLPAEL